MHYAKNNEASVFECANQVLCQITFELQSSARQQKCTLVSSEQIHVFDVFERETEHLSFKVILCQITFEL